MVGGLEGIMMSKMNHKVSQAKYKMQKNIISQEVNLYCSLRNNELDYHELKYDAELMKIRIRNKINRNYRNSDL